ncbi:C40 family peptidase [Rothia sp. HC945]|uniref:C40 family peptidase n=1 Tax=Rothia sp. HC945 TaxID=3171170 RepID=UPI0026551BAF|nr:C40 family peptidase [Kocuria sp.]MDN5616594.1 C40 family peptidase [Kocuria sp.]MDN5655697.1 C40 family peptidase [Kocuria sp.]
MTKHIARHRAATQSHVVRNTGIAVAAAGVIAGSVAPANAFASAAPVENAASTTQASSAQQSISVENADYSAPADNSTQDAGSQATGNRAKIVDDAKTGEGGSYVWGGRDFKAWDCSGFVSWVASQSGVQLDAYTHSMKDQLTPTDAPQPGDVVFTNGYEHVGIYLGDGQMISALNPDQGTTITSVDGGGMMPVDGYYSMPGM